MLYFLSVVGKFWKIFMKKGNAAFMYGALTSVFFLFKKIFRIKVLTPLFLSQPIFSFSNNSFFSLHKHAGYWHFSPAFIFFYLLEHGKPALILSSRLVRGDLKRIPFFFNTETRAYVKVFRWLKTLVQVKNSLFFLLPQRLLFELVAIYKNTSSLLFLKTDLHKELLTTRPNLRFLHKI